MLSQTQPATTSAISSDGAPCPAIDHIYLGPEPLDLSSLVELVKSPAAGAIATFLGTTRDTFQGRLRKVTTLRYTAHAALAMKTCQRILDNVRRSCPSLISIAIAHRIDTVVPVGESSVAIAVSSPHRKEAFASVSQIMDDLKASVEVWKEEVYEDGDVAWKENSEASNSENNINKVM
ncbi:Molybdopterin synthase catalytic subunit [Cladochytrium replicatum]|nr:Molybdopterin synthase catalytic subunit [Cladochytrium replicatum]